MNTGQFAYKGSVWSGFMSLVIWAWTRENLTVGCKQSDQGHCFPLSRKYVNLVSCKILIFLLPVGSAAEQTDLNIIVGNRFSCVEAV